MVSILSGLAGGLVATIAMTMVMLALGDDSPPPTAALWAKYVGDGSPDDYLPQGMVLHMLYGIGAGGVFALGVTAIGAGIGVGALVTSLLYAVAFALVLTVVGAVFWMKVVLAMEPKPMMVGLFALFHIVYGLVLGGSIAFTPL